jgi:hypothetical protein
MIVNNELKVEDLVKKLTNFWNLSGKKIHLIQQSYDIQKGSPVYTVNGAYTTRGWTEWTQGFQFGSAILQFDATGEQDFLEYGKKSTIDFMAPHVSHIGVHDHGFNNVSTYGNLLRLMLEGKIEHHSWEQHFYELALKVSGAVQASRWTKTTDGGFIYSFNGPHSLFVDTIRSVRSLMISHLLGHMLQADHDEKINLLKRGLQHMNATARYSVYYGEGRDSFDVWGRTAHESIFNTNDGHYRCPNAQQGYTGFSTWTRGLAWAIAGFAEELELFKALPPEQLHVIDEAENPTATALKAAKATCDFYIANTPTDGIPYWDTGAPNLHKLGDSFLNQPANPYNIYEPVDSSAAAIASQGLLRLGKYLEQSEPELSKKYWQAGLTIVDRLLEEPYLSIENNHQGLLLHSIYHQPNGWDHIPKGSNIPYGESCMWGDYHAREVALYLHKIINNEKYYRYFNCIEKL